MLCVSCGKDNAAAVSFCEFCGVNLRAPVAAGVPVAAVAAPAPDPAAAAAVIAQAGKSLFKSLTLGEKFAGMGAVAAIIGFFLPFLSSPDLGELSGLFGGRLGDVPGRVSFSLLDMGKFWGAVYFIFLAGVGSALLFWFARSAAASRKLLMNGFQIMIGSLLGPLLLLSLLFVPMVQSVAGLGFWLSALGFCAIATGGLIAIAQVSKSLQ
jgi:hypothetical protein